MIFSSILGKFARFSRIAAGVIVSDFLQIVAPAQKMPTVLGVQVDATLDPGASPADRDAYILTDTAALHANFGTIAGVGDDDIVMYKNGAFVVVFDASAVVANDRIQTRNIATDKDWVYSGGWAASGFDAAADQTITGAWSFTLTSGEIQGLITDDPTLAAPNYLFGIANDFLAPNTLYEYRRTAYGTSGSVGYDSGFNKITGVGSARIIAGNGANNAEIAVSTDGSGNSITNIKGDVIIQNGVQQLIGYKTGTLAAPPAGLIIGEPWADTTDSATHPIYRISTVTT